MSRASTVRVREQSIAATLAGKDGASNPGAVPASADGSEIAILDGLLPTLVPRAQAGDEGAIDRLLSVLELRLKYKREKRVED